MVKQNENNIIRNVLIEMGLPYFNDVTDGHILKVRFDSGRIWSIPKLYGTRLVFCSTTSDQRPVLEQVLWIDLANPNWEDDIKIVKQAREYCSHILDRRYMPNPHKGCPAQGLIWNKK